MTQLAKEYEEQSGVHISTTTAALASSRYALSRALASSLFFFPSWNFLASIAMYQVGEFLWIRNVV